ncbi:MAG: hypothetical protein ACRDRX_02745 [Pseudonocardiaceae bacterium]
MATSNPSVVTAWSGSAAVDRVATALAAVDPSGARFFGTEIRTLCPAPGSLDSRLCANGDPVELSFIWPGDSLRLSCDPAPGSTAAARLQIARALCAAELSATQCVEVRRLKAWGAGHGRWGGWVGSRLISGRPKRKLYVEVVAGAPWRTWGPAARLFVPEACTRTLTPVMAGFDTSCGSIEVYCRTPPLHRDVIWGLVAAVGLPPHAGVLVSAVERMTGQAVRTRLPGHDQGVSITISPGGQVETLTWYTHADALFGPPAQVRAAYLRAAADHGWPVRRYAAMSAPDVTGRVPWHGLAGFSLRGDAQVAISVTCAVRPLVGR